jgi:peptidyl-prolyl cis-trans isomerase SurA
LGCGLISCKSGLKVSADTAAIVNGKEIKQAEIEKLFQNKIKQTRQTPSSGEAQSLRLEILQQLINDEMLMQQAAKDKVEATTAEINTRYAAVKGNLTEERLQQALKEQGLSVEDVREELKKSATIEKLFNKEITSKISVSDTEISEFFSKNKQSFNLPERWRLRHILVVPKSSQAPGAGNARGVDAQGVQAAQTRVMDLLKRVLGGEDFQTVARKNSDDPNAGQTGGDLGFLSAQQIEQQIGPAFRQVLQNVKPGEIIPKPVVTQYGFHVVQVVEKAPAGQRDLSDASVQASIRQNLLNQHDNLLKAAYLERLRNGAVVRNLLVEKVLDEFNESAQPAAKK